MLKTTDMYRLTNPMMRTVANRSPAKSHDQIDWLVVEPLVVGHVRTVLQPILATEWLAC